MRCPRLPNDDPRDEQPRSTLHIAQTYSEIRKTACERVGSEHKLLYCVLVEGVNGCTHTGCSVVGLG